MSDSRSFSSQILKIFLPVSLVILLIGMAVSLFYFLEIRRIMSAGTDAFIQRAGETIQNELTRQTRQNLTLLVRERAKSIAAELKSVNDNLREIEKLIDWTHMGSQPPIDPALIPLATELQKGDKTCRLHMTTPDGTRSIFQGKKIPDWRLLEPLFAVYRELHPEIQTIYFTSADGYTIDYDELGYYKPGSFDGRKRPWYESAIRQNAIAFSNPYGDVYRRGLTVTASFPCKNATGLLGVIGIDYNLEKTCKPIREKSSGAPHSFLLLSREGKVIIQSEDLPDHKQLDFLTGRILRNASGKADPRPDEDDAYAVFWQEVPPAGWKLVLMQPKARITEAAETAGERLRGTQQRISDETNRSIRSATAYLIATAIGAIALLIVVSFRLAAYLNRPIRELNESLKAMSRTGKFEPDLQRQDDLGVLARTLKEIFSDREEEREKTGQTQKK